MFITEYCDDPDNIVCLDCGDHNYSDAIFDEYDSKLKILDRYMYLIDTYSIIMDCSCDLQNITPKSEDAFWRVNKYLLNYVNAVYCYREFVNSYDPPLNAITDKYYKDENGRFWYRFVCDYRNRVIHQSVILRDFAPGDGDVFIDLDELINEQNRIIEDKTKSSKEVKNARRFLDKIQRLANAPHRIRENHRFYSMKKVAEYTDHEITDMNNEILLEALRNAVIPVFEWLLSLMYHDGHIYKYTFIVNKEIRGSELEPNYSLEWYFRKIIRGLGRNNDVVREIWKLLSSKGYEYFYNGQCGIEKFIEHCG